MTKFPYLKEALAKHSPVDGKYHPCVLDTASEPKLDNYQKMSRYCKITVFFPSGEEITTVHYAKDFEAPYNAKVGDKLLVRLNLKGYPEWSMAGDITEGQPLQMVSNTQMASIKKKQQAAVDHDNEREENWRKGKIGQTLGMLWKEFMKQPIGGSDVEAKAGLALSMAKRFRPVFDLAVNDQYEIEKNEADNAVNI